MKTKNIIFTILISILILSVSCENEIEFKGNETSPLLVVNSFCTTDSVIKVHVSKSKFFLQDDYNLDFVNNATVNLWINDIKIEKLISSGNGYYIGNTMPKIGDKIKITAENNQFTEVVGTTQMIQPIKILSVDTTMKLLEKTPLINYMGGGYGNNTNDTIGYTNNRQLNFTVNFNDPVNMKNYYRLIVTLRNYFSVGFYMDSPFYFNSDDLVFGNNATGGIFNEGNYSYYHEFSDDLFDGKKYGLKFYSNQYENVYFKETDRPKNSDFYNYKTIKSELVIDVQSISKSYYLYIKSRAANENVVELFSEPVQIYTNIVGGIGVIGSYTHSIYKLDIPVSTDQKWY